ncbi:hypothetical protein F9B85_09200 [Heliorestis acidaminivorans]|uniref:SpoOB alpha-helical domain-containing protein n=1 Tax=Heliorestis acidaminivorans TaxID=553427 RepID=A0A6I0EW95_9FIRM|nr:Spo0B domain-containing protein [Heliorestis acidaminivorans]KAB2952325.1 hypothetical protein F9B85_09200 [Heliorestis acidaminivorans]
MGNINYYRDDFDNESELWIEVWREMRHDCINHLQILMGYVQLGKIDKANDFVKNLASKIREDGDVMLLGVLPLIVMLIHKKFTLRKEEILLHVKVANNWDPQTWQKEENVQELLEAVRAFIDVMLEEGNSFNESNQLYLLFHGGQCPYLESYWEDCSGQNKHYPLQMP